MDNRELAKQGKPNSNDYSPEGGRIITARRPGPITLDLSVVAGIIMVGVGPVDRAQVELLTPDRSGPAYDLINNPPVTDRGDKLSIDARVRGNTYGSVNISGTGVVIVNGVVISGGGATLNGSGLIEIRAVLPFGSALIANTTSADVLVRGPLQGARVKTMSGGIELEAVSGLDAESMSGSIRVDELTGDGRAKSMSGDVRVASGGAWTLDASSMSGDVVAPKPIRLRGSSMSGRVRNY